MGKLRDLLDKQAAETRPPAVPEKGVSLAETFASAPPLEKPKGFLGRLQVTPKPNGGLTAQPIPGAKVAQAIGAVIVATAVPDLPQSTIDDLRKNLDFLAENIDQKNLVGQVVRTIAVQLQENPQFSSCMKDTDFDLLVRGLRKSYNIAARRRVDANEKREEKREDVLELESMMKDLGVSFKI